MYLLILLFIGILLVTINIVKNKYDKPKEKIIEYRYKTRTFEDEQINPDYVSNIFKTMFSEQSPWVFSVQNTDWKKKEEINNFFTGQ